MNILKINQYLNYFFLDNNKLSSFKSPLKYLLKLTNLHSYTPLFFILVLIKLISKSVLSPNTITDLLVSLFFYPLLSILHQNHYQ